MLLVFVKHLFSSDYIHHKILLLERLCSLELSCVQYVQNIFLVILFDSYISLHMLNLVIQVNGYLTHEFFLLFIF